VATATKQMHLQQLSEGVNSLLSRLSVCDLRIVLLYMKIVLVMFSDLVQVVVRSSVTLSVVCVCVCVSVWQWWWHPAAWSAWTCHQIVWKTQSWTVGEAAASHRCTCGHQPWRTHQLQRICRPCMSLMHIYIDHMHCTWQLDTHRLALIVIVFYYYQHTVRRLLDYDI